MIKVPPALPRNHAAPAEGSVEKKKHAIDAAFRLNACYARAMGKKSMNVHERTVNGLAPSCLLLLLQFHCSD